MNKKTKIWLVVLAAGFSTRMGAQKLLFPAPKESMLRMVVKTACNSKADGIVVVLNPHFPLLENELKDLDVKVVWNSEAASGMSTSLKKGIDNLPKGIDAAGILLGDQPGMKEEVINDLISHYTKERVVISQPAYDGIPNHPVLFDKTLFKDLKKVSGDKGGRMVIENNKKDRRLLHKKGFKLHDIDTKQDYERYVLKEVFKND
ncbi:NTP transferase domain-containing protein [Alteribacillus sp. JSM 102045]|uniref:nucleotidyltransferase family protein n=1 Tax=Alteribacillus sp. JSM 102045 TaxID=1562101 RepID=UPI0035C04328